MFGPKHKFIFTQHISDSRWSQLVKQLTTLIFSKDPLVYDATYDQKVEPSEEIPSTSLPQALKPRKKIGRKKKKSKRRRRLREVSHFDSDEEEDFDLEWRNFFYAWRPRVGED